MRTQRVLLLEARRQPRSILGYDEGNSQRHRTGGGRKHQKRQGLEQRNAKYVHPGASVVTLEEGVELPMVVRGILQYSSITGHIVNIYCSTYL